MAALRGAKFAALGRSDMSEVVRVNPAIDRRTDRHRNRGSDAKLEDAILKKPEFPGAANRQKVRDLDAAFTLWPTDAARSRAPS